MRVYDKVDLAECWRAIGKAPIAGRRVDIDKGDTVGQIMGCGNTVCLKSGFNRQLANQCVKDLESPETGICGLVCVSSSVITMG